MNTEIVIEKLDSIQRMLTEQNLLKKEVLSFNEAAIYLELSHSHLYKLTSNGTLPFYKPNGKKIYFRRDELDQWLLSAKQLSLAEIHAKAENLQIKSRRS